MNTDRSVSLQNTYASYLDVTRPSHGRIATADTSINCGSVDSGAPQFDVWCHKGSPVGSLVTVFATPTSGYQFSGWTGAASSCGTNTACTLALSVATGHIAISASFSVPAPPPPPPVCTPGATRGCCTCRPGMCSDPGVQTCRSNGQWGACVGSQCGPLSLTDSSQESLEDDSADIPPLSISPPTSQP
jgi:hypothetical protein